MNQDIWHVFYSLIKLMILIAKAVLAPPLRNDICLFDQALNCESFNPRINRAEIPTMYDIKHKSSIEYGGT